MDFSFEKVTKVITNFIRAMARPAIIAISLVLLVWSGQFIFALVSQFAASGSLTADQILAVADKVLSFMFGIIAMSVGFWMGGRQSTSNTGN